MIELEPVPYEDKLVLRELLNLYLYDLSDLDETDPDPHGRFEYRWLDPYWIEPSRHPVFIRRDGVLAGFLLVSGHAEGGAQRGISEFFVLKRHRRAGVGLAAAPAIFEKFPGSWEIRAERQNHGAIAFWEGALPRIASDVTAHRDGIGAWTGPAWTCRVLAT